MTHEEYRKRLEQSVREAHRELFGEYCNYVYTIVFNRLRSCASREDMEECVCDVFADVYSCYDTQKNVSGDMSGFIGTIARRKSAAYYRKSTSAAAVVSIDDEDAAEIDAGIDIAAGIEQKERSRAILDAVEKLGEPDSTIIIQKYYYGRSAKEIGDMVSLTPENVRVRSGRAVRKLKEMLEKAGISL